jgi:hypothetical protein
MTSLARLWYRAKPANQPLNWAPGGRVAAFRPRIFLAYPDPELPDRPSPVTFALGADGKVSDVTIGFLDGNGPGTLKRAEE